MTTNKQQDETLVEDLVFIQSLYDDLKNSDIEAEQPSELLDKRILTAAQRELAASSEEKTDDNVEPIKQPTQKRKGFAWFYPASMAASVLLMVTLVNHQFNETEFRTPLESNAVTESFSLAAPQAKSAVTSRSVKPLPRVEALSESEEVLIANSEQQMADIAATRQRLAQQQLAKQAKSKRLSAKIQQTAVINLSYEEYAALQKEFAVHPLYWLLEEEDDNSYLIKLLQPKNRAQHYRLNKKNFHLDSNQPFKAKPFDQIKYLPINESK